LRPLTPSKYRQTFATFEANTGAAHPLSGKMTSSMTKRGAVPLINEETYVWYGEIEVGTPKQAFNGKEIPTVNRLQERSSLLNTHICSIYRYW
jgi:hypothetical protein